MITLQDYREPALAAGYEAMRDRIPDHFSFGAFRETFASWDVKALFDGEKTIGMIVTKDDELHVAVLPEVRGKWLSRRLIREVFAPLFHKFGRATTKVAPDNEVGKRFVERIGFAKTDGDYLTILREGFAHRIFDPATIIGAVAGPIIGGLIGGNASGNAADTQTAAAGNASQVQQNALNFQKQMYGDTTANLQPFLGGGQQGYGALLRALGIPGYNPDAQIAGANGESMVPVGSLLKPFGLQDFQESPAYQFNLQRGQDAINKASAQRGTFYAPQTLQDISKFSQGIASNEFNNAYQMYNQNQANQYNRLAGQAGVGQNAAVQQGGFAAGIGNASASTANQIAGNINSAGSSQASGIMGTANALAGGISGIYNNLQNYYAQQQQPTYPGVGGFGDPGSNNVSIPIGLGLPDSIYTG